MIPTLPPPIHFDTRSVEEYKVDNFDYRFNSSVMVLDILSKDATIGEYLIPYHSKNQSSSVFFSNSNDWIIEDEVEDKESWVLKTTPKKSYTIKASFSQKKKGKPVLHFLDPLDENEY